MVEKPGFFSRVFRLGLVQDGLPHFSPIPLPMQLRLADDVSVENDATPVRIIRHSSPIGSSGSLNFSGYPSEEFLQELSGIRAATVYDKMRRSEPKIRMVLNAVKNIIKAATWEVDLPDEDIPNGQTHSDFINHILFKDADKSWRQLLNEILTFLDFGFSVFEVTHKTVLGHKQFGDYTGIRSIALRGQKTIVRFNLDRETGKLASVSQQAQGDLQRYVDIPSLFLLTFTLEKEGDNYEGISMLRSCYGPWLRKQTYLKLEAIGIEKFAVPTPVGTIPAGKEGTEQAERFRDALRSWSSHEENFLVIPENWKVEFVKNEFDSSKIRSSIDGESKEMADAFLAGFLALGDKGSYARSFNESDFFLSSIEYIAHLVSETINLSLIPQMIDLNYGPQESYPTLKYSGISDRGGKELADALKSLCDSKAIIPDDDLEDHIRKRFDFPKKSDKGQRYGGQIDTGVPANSPEAQSLPDAATAGPKTGPVSPMSYTHAERRLTLAEKRPKQQIQNGKILIHQAMKDGLTPIAQDLVKQIMGRVKRLPPSQQLQAIKNLNLTGTQDYRQAMRDTLAEIAQAALTQARREVPKAMKIKLSERNLTLSEFDQLPASVKKKVQLQSDLLVDTQLGDLEKAVYFQFTHSVDSTDSESILESDLSDAADSFLEGANLATGAMITSSVIVNTSRQAFFFDDEVSQEIESFTFINGDSAPCPLCDDLGGTTFAKDDPESDRYFAPLHHNCACYIVPNLVGGSTGKTIEPLKPSSADLDKYMTLHECCPKKR